MIQFNELRIVDGRLIIDISVRDLACYTNVYIGSLKLDNQNTFSLNGPSDGAYDIPASEIHWGDEDHKTAHIELTQKTLIDGTSNISLDNDLIFVYAIVSDDSIPAPDTPCGMDREWSVGAAANLTKLYNRGISYIKELANSCEIPAGFADFILKYKAFVLSLRACDFQQAIKFWNKFFGKDTKIVTRGCGCHGGYRN